MGSNRNEKILEIESAYYDLIRAYISCLVTPRFNPPRLKLVLDVRGLLDWRRRHVPSVNPWKWSIELLSYITLVRRIVRWHIRRNSYFLRENFLLLISRGRGEGDPEVLKRFETHTADMERLENHVGGAGLKALWISALASLPVLKEVTGYKIPIEINVPTQISNLLIPKLLLLYAILYTLDILVFHYIAYRRILDECGVVERENRIYMLMREYAQLR